MYRFMSEYEKTQLDKQIKEQAKEFTANIREKYKEKQINPDIGNYYIEKLALALLTNVAGAHADLGHDFYGLYLISEINAVLVEANIIKTN